MLDFQEGPIAKIEVRGEEVAVGRDPYTCKCIVFRFSDGMLLIEKILPERPERPDVLSLSTRNILRLGTICNLRQGLSIEDVRQLYQDCVFSLLNSPKFVAKYVKEDGPWYHPRFKKAFDQMWAFNQDALLASQEDPEIPLSGHIKMPLPPLLARWLNDHVAQLRAGNIKESAEACLFQAFDRVVNVTAGQDDLFHVTFGDAEFSGPTRFSALAKLLRFIADHDNPSRDRCPHQADIRSDERQRQTKRTPELNVEGSGVSSDFAADG
jgi:hypothetical protein